MPSLYFTKTPDETMNLGKQLADRLMPGSTVLLFGDLGSGKTHFTKGIAMGLGIEAIIKSPTFTYVNSYKIASEEHEAKSMKQKKLTAHRSPLTALYHYDLYRLQPNDSFHSIGLEETMNDPTAINIIEWADRLGENLPKDYIRVTLKSHSEFHEIQIAFHDSEVVNKVLVEQFWEVWATPIHVREHCKQVAKVALEVGHALIKKNRLLNLEFLETGALLHDMARVCDFKTMYKEDFKEEITEEKWARWMELREIYSHQHHPEIAFEALNKKAYQKTAEIIRLHNSLAIVEEPEKFENLETALLYYADKRVKHDEIVSLSERFQDGRERYGSYDSEEQKKLYLAVEKKTFELEKTLFKSIDLEPDDIR